uniref:G-protein coupled receptors family 1 profile domain-containing protein n=1 Tax=Anguilla anguilla TaxID=7936 RepID=A0A0E9VYF9_ANGAN
MLKCMYSMCILTNSAVPVLYHVFYVQPVLFRLAHIHAMK